MAYRTSEYLWLQEWIERERIITEYNTLPWYARLCLRVLLRAIAARKEKEAHG